MTTEELNALIVQAENGDISAMNKLSIIYGEPKYLNYSQAIRWYRVLLQKDNDPKSGVFHATHYNKTLCEKMVKALDNAVSESDLNVLIRKCLNLTNERTCLFEHPLVFVTDEVKNDIREIQRILGDIQEQKRIDKENREKEEHLKDLKRRAAAGDFKAECEIVFSDPEKAKALLQKLKKTNNL